MDDPEEFSVTRSAEHVVTIKRAFHASASSVFAALTTPDALRQWLTANGRKMTSCQIDLRPGGEYRYEFSMGRGKTFGMHGNYLEVVEEERIVSTEAYDGLDWDPLVVTTELSEHSGVTTLTVNIEYPSKEICDADAPNLENAGKAYVALAEHLASR